jgi:hypothetical protein
MRVPAEVRPFSKAIARAGLDCSIRCLHESDRMAQPDEPVSIVVDRDGDVLFEKVCLGRELPGLFSFLTTAVETGLIS